MKKIYVWTTVEEVFTGGFQKGLNPSGVVRMEVPHAQSRRPKIDLGRYVRAKATDESRELAALALEDAPKEVIKAIQKNLLVCYHPRTRSWGVCN